MLDSCSCTATWISNVLHVWSILPLNCSTQWSPSPAVFIVSFWLSCPFTIVFGSSRGFPGSPLTGTLAPAHLSSLQSSLCILFCHCRVSQARLSTCNQLLAFRASLSGSCCGLILHCSSLYVFRLFCCCIFALLWCLPCLCERRLFVDHCLSLWFCLDHPVAHCFNECFYCFDFSGFGLVESGFGHWLCSTAPLLISRISVRVAQTLMQSPFGCSCQLSRSFSVSGSFASLTHPSG